MQCDIRELDLSQYNFFLMPISFFHGFEAAEPTSRAAYPAQIQKLLEYLDAVESQDMGNECQQHVALRLQTRHAGSRPRPSRNCAASATSCARIAS